MSNTDKLLEDQTVKIFVTGGTGFVGKTLTQKLSVQGHQVTVLTRKINKNQIKAQGISFIEGDPTREDIETLNRVISELNHLVSGITLDTVIWDPDIEIYFASSGQFPSIEPNYVPGNKGFFWAWWDSSGALYKARILVATDGITQKQRSHIIREELTQCLGIMNDSYEYEDSIFYQEWTDTESYAEIDRAVISILYDPRIEPGMDMEQVEEVIYTDRW